MLSERPGERDPSRREAMNNRKRQREELNTAELEREPEPAFGELRGYVPADILKISFPAAGRGQARARTDRTTGQRPARAGARNGGRNHDERAPGSRGRGGRHQGKSR